MVRVKLLSAGKLAALALFVSVAAVLAIYLTMRGKRAESGPEPLKLQGRVVAVFNNTRYAHEVEGRIRFVITAGVDKAYEDGSHELEEVRLESFGADGTRGDSVTADRAKVSDPSDLNRLDAEFISNVVVQLSDDLTVKTSYLHYDHNKSVVETKEPVEFDGPNLSGRSTGVMVEATDERVHLLKDVDVTIKADGKAGQTVRPNETAEEKAARKARKRARRQARLLNLKSRGAKAHDPPLVGTPNVGRPFQISDEKPSTKTRIAKSVKPAERKPTRIRAAAALLDNKQRRASFAGGVIVTQGADEMRADRMVGYIDAQNHIERIEARGNSYLKEADKAEIKSADMDFFFGDAQQLLRAVALGGAYTRSLGPEPVREAQAETIEVTFADGPEGNVAEAIKAEGNAVIRVAAPANDKANPATRELTAGTVTLEFFPDGRNIESAEATGGAVMTVTPVRAERGANKKTIRAPEMKGLFFEEGNRVKTFNATGGVKVEVEALVPGEHPPRVTTSKELTALFFADSQDVERIAQEGDFKYNEGDRNAVAERAIYEGASEILRLRGKRPTAWDSKARTQADEIDYDRRRDETEARGDVRTTYYSRETTNDATPFKNGRSPIFVTAERGTALSREGVAIYTGNARGWQDDNFVKADRIELYEKDKRMAATGNVESALYTVRREAQAGKREAAPGFASADRMTYSDKERLVHYDGKVRARQGTDRIEASAIDVYLQKEANDVERLLADGNVVLTQPGRRGTGDNLVYTASDGRAVLTGKTARVDDAEKGTTMGAQLTFHSRDDKIFVDNQRGTGRVRSTHRLTKSGKE